MATSESLHHATTRSLHRLRQIQSPLEKYQYLNNLRHQNTTLFYSVITQNLRETISIIYTPTVADTPDGIFIGLEDVDRIDEILENWCRRNGLNEGSEPEICVVTDGSRILGIGDQGVNGMGIPVGKLSLYVAAAGLHPSRTLPITLDLGTNNQSLLNDPNYLGSRNRRPSEETFTKFTDTFMQRLHAKFPKILTQFEDFSSEHAFSLLNRYRSTYNCFNDDIQGTGAVILSGFINAIRLSGVAPSDHKILFVGAGSAGVGVAKQILDHFVMDEKHGGEGMTYEDAMNMFYLMDSKGLVTDNRKDSDRYPEHKKLFMRRGYAARQIGGLKEAVREIRPTAIVGLSSMGGVFCEEVLGLMKEFNERPIVFPLSNPIDNAECTFSAAVTHTNGSVLFASGTAFPPTPHPTHTHITLEPNQGNNMYIFPGLGLGCVLAQTKTVTDDMVHRSAISLAGSLNKEEVESGLLYPRLERIREVCLEVAVDVIVAAGEVEGNVGCGEVRDILEGGGADVKGRLREWVREKMYVPTY
ncbi:hypothetical protein HDU76_002502 [Blyttiomyces sp. JEL0837]|nr:hypothetical protein HDU76_002502 [Blyttiomyces sp. JEL0837]